MLTLWTLVNLGKKHSTYAFASQLYSQFAQTVFADDCRTTHTETSIFRVRLSLNSHRGLTRTVKTHMAGHADTQQPIANGIANGVNGVAKVPVQLTSTTPQVKHKYSFVFQLSALN